MNLNPHIVFCPYPDRHIDHRLVFESVMVVTRPVGFANKLRLLLHTRLYQKHTGIPHIEPNFT